MLALLLALPILATATAAEPMPAGTPPALGAPYFAQVVTMTGLPPDSLARGAFQAAFEAAFIEDHAPGQRRDGAGNWAAGEVLPNRFRMLMGSPADDAWRLDVSVGAPPLLRVRSPVPGKPARTVRDRRSSRGMVVAYTLHVPDTPGGAAARTVVQRVGFTFPSGSGDATLAIPATGYTYPWADAGRAAGRLALELLHRESGEWRENERADIAPALRLEAGR